MTSKTRGRDQLEDVLVAAEQAERRNLKALQASRSIWAEQRASMATIVLESVAEVRRNLAPGHKNAVAAATAAFLVGFYGNRAAIDAQAGRLAGEIRQAGGRMRGIQKADVAKRHDPAIARYDRQWHNSDELQDQHGYRSSVPYIKKRTNIDTRTIQRALKRLRTRQ